MSVLIKFAEDESGATAIEYGLLAAAVSVVIIPALAALGLELFDWYDDLANSINQNGG